MGARPLNVTYKTGAGATVQDTTTSGGSEATAAASISAGTHPSSASYSRQLHKAI